MANRHYLKMINNSTKEQVLRRQILGNNDYFDEKFYNAFGIELNEDYAFDVTEVSILDLIYQWHNFLQRHLNMLGLPVPNTKENLELYNGNFKEYLFYFYATADSYELQLYRIIGEIANILMDNCALIHPEKQFIFTLECF